MAAARAGSGAGSTASIGAACGDIAGAAAAGIGNGCTTDARSVAAGREETDACVQSKLSTSAASRIRFALNDIRLSGGRAGDDQAFFLELARDGDDFLLRLFDLAQPDRAEDVHLVLHHLGGPLRHVPEEAAADLFARALERDGQHLLVGAGDDLAQRVVLELPQV